MTWVCGDCGGRYHDAVPVCVPCLARERDRLREALGAYRSALRCGEPESEQLRALGDKALA